MTTYPPERQELHRRIIDSIFSQNTASSVNGVTEPPHLIVIGGAPGGGKTTITRWLEKHKLIEGPYITLDKDTFRILPEFDQIFARDQKPHPEKAPELVDEYYHVRQMIMEEAVKRKVTVVLEDHLDSNLHTGNEHRDKELLDTAKHGDFKTVLLAMTVTPYDYFGDWKVRNYKAEHVPYVFGIHKNLASRWKEITSMFDHSFLYQRNSEHGAYFDGMYHLSMIGSFTPGKETVYAPRKFGRFELWKEVDAEGTTLEKAFPRREAEPDSDYERRMGGPGNGIPGEGAKPGFVARVSRKSNRLIE